MCCLYWFYLFINIIYIVLSTIQTDITISL